jgi:cobalt-precorrin-5B (C1)-methyltransferase
MPAAAPSSLSHRPHGYTLPVWVAAGAAASLAVLLGEEVPAETELQLSDDETTLEAIPVKAGARLSDGWGLAETICDPGDGLDLTRGLLVWVFARLEPRSEPLEAGKAAWRLEAGEGVGVDAGSGELCSSAYARRLLDINLSGRIPAECELRLRLVLPAGRRLAERTSNAAFGVVDGLALIGTQAETQASADPDQLERTLATLRQRLDATDFAGDLVLVIGENGLDLAPRLGLPAHLLIKCGNWLGPVLVAAGQGGVRRLLLFGYQGKLIKLAGGIFHTHHHLADGRLEILTAHAALEGLSGDALRDLHAAATVEAALSGLDRHDGALAERVRRRVATTIETRCLDYLDRHGATGAAVGAVLFDRSRRIRAWGPVGERLLRELGGDIDARTAAQSAPRVQAEP